MIEISNLEKQNNILQQKEINSAYCTYKNIQKHLLIHKKIIKGYENKHHFIYDLHDPVLSDDDLPNQATSNTIIDMLYISKTMEMFHKYEENSIIDFIKLYDIETKIDLNQKIVKILNDIFYYFNNLIQDKRPILYMNRDVVRVEFLLFKLFKMAHDLSNSFCLIYQNMLLSENQTRKMFNNLSSLCFYLAINMRNRNSLRSGVEFRIFYCLGLKINKLFLFDFDDHVINIFNNFGGSVNNTNLDKLFKLQLGQNFDGVIHQKIQNRLISLIVFLEFIKNKSYFENNIVLIKDIEQILIKLSHVKVLNKNFAKSYIQNCISILMLLFYHVGIIANLNSVYENLFTFILTKKIDHINFSYKSKLQDLLKETTKEQLKFPELRRCMMENLENLLNNMNNIFQKFKKVKDLDKVIVYMVNLLNASLKIDHPKSFFITFLDMFNNLYDKYKKKQNNFLDLDIENSITYVNQMNTITYQIYKSQYELMYQKTNNIEQTLNKSK